MIATEPHTRKRSHDSNTWEYELSPEVARPTRPGPSVVSARKDVTIMERPVRPSSSLAPMVMLFLAAAGSFAYFAHRGHLVGEISSIVLLPCALHGVWRGGFRKTVMLATTIGLIYLLSVKPDFAAPLITAATGAPAGTVGFAAAGILAMTAWITVFFIARTIQRRVIERRRFLAMTNRFFGALIGGAEGALVVLTVCWCAASLKPFAENLVRADDAVAGSAKDRIGKYLAQIASESDTGLLGQLTQATNPISQVPALRNAVDQLNTTGRLDFKSLDSSTIKEMQGFLEQRGMSKVGQVNDLVNRLNANTAAQQDAARQLQSGAGRKPGQ